MQKQKKKKKKRFIFSLVFPQELIVREEIIKKSIRKQVDHYDAREITAVRIK